MKVTLSVNTQGNASDDSLAITIHPETDYDAMLLRQLEYATPTFHMTPEGKLEGSLRVTRE